MYAVSQTGGLPHINTSIYSIDTTFYVLFTNVIRNSDAIIAKKQQKWWSQKKEHIRPGPGPRLVSVYMTTVRTQTGKKVTCLSPVTETKSDWSGSIFRPVSCKHKKRNVRRPIRTHASLSLYRSLYVNTPFTCNQALLFWLKNKCLMRSHLLSSISMYQLICKTLNILAWQ